MTGQVAWKPRGPLSRVLFLSGNLSLQCETLRLKPTCKSHQKSNLNGNIVTYHLAGYDMIIILQPSISAYIRILGYFHGISSFPPCPKGEFPQLQDVSQRITGFEMWNTRPADMTTQFRQPVLGSEGVISNTKTSQLVGPPVAHE